MIHFRPEVVDFPGHSIDVQPKVINGKIVNRQTAFIGDRARYSHESGRVAKHGSILRLHCRRQQKGKCEDSEITPHEPSTSSMAERTDEPASAFEPN